MHTIRCEHCGEELEAHLHCHEHGEQGHTLASSLGPLSRIGSPQELELAYTQVEKLFALIATYERHHPNGTKEAQDG